MVQVMVGTFYDYHRKTEGRVAVCFLTGNMYIVSPKDNVDLLITVVFLYALLS